MAYWCAQLQPRHERQAQHFLELEGYSVYAPRVRERRTIRGRRVEVIRLLFPNYCFIAAALQWWRAQRVPGVECLVFDGMRPACVSDVVIDAIRKRERNGLVRLPKFRPGDRVRITQGPLRAIIGLYDGQAPHERVAVLMQLFGAERRLEFPADAIEPA